MLVVRDGAKQWSKMQVFVSRDMVGADTIDSICRLGESFGLSPELLLDSRDKALSEKAGTAASSASLREVIDGSADDVLLVVSAEVLDSVHDSIDKARLYKFLQASDGRALLLWRDRNKATDSARRAS